MTQFELFSSVTKKRGRPRIPNPLTGAERQARYIANLKKGKHRKQKPDSKLDLWPTPPVALELLLDVEKIEGGVLEPCAGKFHLVNVLRARGHPVVTGDVANHVDDLGFTLDYQRDFLEVTAADFDSSVRTMITNFPYGFRLRLLMKMLRHALKAFPGWKIVAFVPSNFLSVGKTRMDLRTPVTKIYYFNGRLPRLHLDGWTGNLSTNQTDYCWVVYEQGREPEPPEVLVLPKTRADRGAVRHRDGLFNHQYYLP